MKKKLIARILCTALVLGMVFSLTVPFASAAGGTYYTDINDSSDVGRAVNYLYDHDIMKGPIYAVPTKTNALQASRFLKDQATTRLQLVHAMWNMYGSPAASATTRMRDIYIKTEYATAMNWAISAGIINPVSTGKYAPDASLSVEETLLMLYRFVDYCGYDVNVGRTAMIRPDNSETNKALSWAISKKFITRISFKGDFTVDCSRGNAAVYIYKIYELYQKKYGLTVVNTKDLEYGSVNAGIACGDAMAAVFEKAGAIVEQRRDINYVARTTSAPESFVDSMETAFCNAKALDICYLYCYSHGGEAGLGLFQSYPTTLSPEKLRDEINKYNGTFVVFIQGCHSGTFISKGIHGDTSAGGQFNPEEFAGALVADTDNDQTSAANDPFKIDLRDVTNQIKVLCSSHQKEVSYRYWPAYYWAYGCSYYMDTNSFSGEELPADQDQNDRITLQELYEYSNKKIVDRYSDKQHIVCYPENDDYIIFEIRDREFH